MNKLRYNVSFWLGALFLFVTGGCSDYFDVLRGVKRNAIN